MLGRKGTIVLTVALLIIFSGMTYVTIFNSKTALSTSGGYLNVTASQSQKQLVFVKEPGCIEFNITVKTDASTVSIFSFGNVSTGSGSYTNLTSFINTSSMYNGLVVNSTDRYNYVTVTNFKNDTIINLKMMVSSSAFENMQPFNPQNSDTVYPVTILVIGSNDGADGTGFGLVKL
jgi:hypothetical protein